MASKATLRVVIKRKWNGGTGVQAASGRRRRQWQNGEAACMTRGRRDDSRGLTRRWRAVPLYACSLFSEGGVVAGVEGDAAREVGVTLEDSLAEEKPRASPYNRAASVAGDATAWYQRAYAGKAFRG